MMTCDYGHTRGKGPDVTDQGEFDGIELSIPAQPNLLYLVRMTAGAVAARADLALDDVEDLRLAVDELACPSWTRAVDAGAL